MYEEPFIRVWRWPDAPAMFKTLSPHGGDEDWVALIPPEMEDEYIPWMESETAFGCCDVSEHDHPRCPGWKVRIGAHA